MVCGIVYLIRRRYAGCPDVVTKNMLKLLIIILKVISIVKAQDLNEDFHPPAWPKFKQQINGLSHLEKPKFYKDDKSGCLCREYPNKWTVCFGSESCRRFPSTASINSTTLKIQTTLIESLDKGDLDEMRHLNSLDIEGNYLLREIRPGTFRNMSNLTNMSISYNSNLKILNAETFEGLINLKELLLVKNGFSKIIDVSVSLSVKNLPIILKISLSENIFKDILENDFKPMFHSSIRELNLVLCQIDYIHPSALAPLKRLTTIRLGENRFTSTTLTDLIVKTIEFGIPLKVVNFYSVGFRKTLPEALLEAIAKSNITHLSLGGNQFEEINQSTFIEMLNLQYLDLREVLATNITTEAFLGMPNLRTLLVSGNKLSSVPDGVLLENLTYLDISQNSGNPYLPSYFSLGRSRFVKMKKLKYLNLSYNRINTLFNSSFTGLSKLRVIGLKNASIYHITDNAFLPLHDLLVLNLENNHFAKNNTLNKNIFTGLQNLQVLLLGGCHISYISPHQNPFINLPSLAHLGLENNHFLTIDPHILTPLSNLHTFDISRNFITSWQKSLFRNNKHLTILLVSHNKISYISKAMLKDFCNLSRLDISENPFVCECSLFLPIVEWNTKDTVLKLVGENPGYCAYPDKLVQKSIVDFFHMMPKEGSSCRGNFLDSQSYLLYGLVISAFVVLLVIVVTSSYLYRWHIRYWLFLIRIKILRNGRLKPIYNSQLNYIYDVFVSYCNEDRNFVVRLVAMLENFEPFFKLCVYERDFLAGSLISDTVLESVRQSRKTLLIISDSYARSKWCRWEVQMAENHRIFLDRRVEFDDSLVMIKLGDISAKHCTPTLKYLMKTRIYLEWDAKQQNVFWEKLRNALRSS